MKRVEFQKARAVWAENRASEMNCELAFRAVIPGLKEAAIAIATSGIYRLLVNGEFVAAGPARTAHGFFRVDEYGIEERLNADENVVVVEVLGYNVNSYDTLNQMSFLTAEIRSRDGVATYTGDESEACAGTEVFRGYDLKQRVQKVQRYSFQRAFIDAYRMSAEKKSFYTEALGHSKGNGKKEPWEYLRQRTELKPEPCYIARDVRYPGFEVLPSEAVILEGSAAFDNSHNKVIDEQEYFKISNQLLGFCYEEVKEHVSEEAQRICFFPKNKLRQAPGPRHLNNGYALYRFPYNATGFYRIDVAASEKSRIFIQFDELLTGEDIDFLRMYSCNCFVYTVEPGCYQLMSFAPYTMKYLKVTVKGACTVNKVEMVEYKHPEEAYEVKLPREEEELQLICRAAVESFKANAVDVFMDCPSRERGGWLCDSYFTSSVERVLTGENVLERAFLENFILKDSFEYLPEGMLPMCYPGDHNNGNYIPNWAMWYVLELEKYVKDTGDQSLAEQAREAVYRLLPYYLSHENEYGLLENLGGWIFIEWSRANDEDLVKGVNFPSNMLYARMLEAVGNLYGDQALQKKATALRKTIRMRSLKNGFYTDHEHREGDGWANSGESTEVCQYYAFFLRVASCKEDKALWDILVREFGPGRREHNTYPGIAFTNAFIGNYLRVELLYENGMYDQVIANIKEYFLPMARETQTLWEHEKPTGSCNHGFASYVIYWLAGIYGVTEKIS